MTVYGYKRKLAITRISIKFKTSSNSPVYRGDSIPNYVQTWLCLVTRPLSLGLSRHITPNGWVCNGRYRPGLWYRLPFVPLVPASLLSRDGIQETSRLVPPPLGLKHVGHVRSVPPPLAPRGTWRKASLSSTLVPSVPYGVVFPLCTHGSVVPKSYAPVGRMFPPIFQ